MCRGPCPGAGDQVRPQNIGDGRRAERIASPERSDPGADAQEAGGGTPKKQ
jgi:hypothetical protein